MKLFVDRDLGKKLGRSLNAIGIPTTIHDDRYPNAPAETVRDQDWIRDATTRGEVLLTRDGAIRRVDVEIRAVVESRARCFILETGNATPLDYLRALMAAWPKIVNLVETDEAPFVYGIRRDGRVIRRYPPPP